MDTSQDNQANRANRDNNGNPFKRGHRVPHVPITPPAARTSPDARRFRAAAKAVAKQRKIPPPTRPALAAQPAQQIREPPKDPPPVAARPTSPVAAPRPTSPVAAPRPPLYFSIPAAEPAPAKLEPGHSAGWSPEARVQLQRRRLGADLIQRADELGATSDQLEEAISSGPEQGIHLLRKLIDDLRSKRSFSGGGKKRRYSKKRKYKKKTKRKKSKRKKSKRKKSKGRKTLKVRKRIFGGAGEPEPEPAADEPTWEAGDINPENIQVTDVDEMDDEAIKIHLKQISDDINTRTNYGNKFVVLSAEGNYPATINQAFATRRPWTFEDGENLIGIPCQQIRRKTFLLAFIEARELKPIPFKRLRAGTSLDYQAYAP